MRPVPQRTSTPHLDKPVGHLAPPLLGNIKKGNEVLTWAVA